jgi:hypothetical protein
LHFNLERSFVLLGLFNIEFFLTLLLFMHFGPTPRYTKKNSALCGIGRSLKKVLSETLRYATECEIQVKNFLVDSALCGVDFRRRI